MEKNQNKALWIFPNFKESIDTIPQKYRGRAWEVLIEYGFSGKIDLDKENKYVQIVVKSLLPLMKLRGIGGSVGGISNNPTGKKKASIGANVGANIGANVGAAPYKQELEQELEQEQEIEYSKKIFKKPTLEEVKQYCLERGNNIDAEKFIDSNEAKGWMIGKNKMKDWKAAIRTWEKNQIKWNSEQKQEKKWSY